MSDAVGLLLSLGALELLAMFWHLVVLEVPRYLLPGVVVALLDAVARPPRGAVPRELTVSVLLPGHNEAQALERSVRSIHAQSRRPEQIIIIDDGSTDGMAAVARRLQRAGWIDIVLSTRLRAGKSAAANLGLLYASGDVIVIADVDTSYDDDAFARLLEPFVDPRVGGVAGNLGVRNATTLIARWQAVQYLESISLGRRISDLFGILFIVSGAFGAFRRRALEQVGGWDVGPGEDADITAKLRRAGWHVRFAPEAWSLTDVPETLPALVRQRLRWNRSLVRIRMRKFASLVSPAQASFRLRDALGVIDILFFQLVMSVSFAAYLVWVFATYGSLAWTVLLCASLVYMALGLLSFLAACAVSRHRARLDLIPEALTYGLFNSYLLRFVRLWAVLDELLQRGSYRDEYVPDKVRARTVRY